MKYIKNLVEEFILGFVPLGLAKNKCVGNLELLNDKLTIQELLKECGKEIDQKVWDKVRFIDTEDCSYTLRDKKGRVLNKIILHSDKNYIEVI